MQLAYQSFRRLYETEIQAFPETYFIQTHASKLAFGIFRVLKIEQPVTLGDVILFHIISNSCPSSEHETKTSFSE